MKYYSQKTASPDESQRPLWHKSSQQGQTMVEYALILVLVAVSFGLGLSMTAPAISSAFQSTIYGLLGQESEFRAYENPGDFWLTVTWVAENPPLPRRIPTRTIVPPTKVDPHHDPDGNDDEDEENPGGGGYQPGPTITPVPTSTPVDLGHVAPWHDTVDNPDWYRLGSSPYLGSADWYGEYFPSANLTGESLADFNRNFYGAPSDGILKFPSQQYHVWRNQDTGPLLNSPDFSVRFTRNIYVTGNIPLQFNIQASGGVRMWLIPGTVSGSTVTYPTLAECGSNCVQIFNEWTDGHTNSNRLLDVNQGHYRLHLEYYNRSGTPKILNLDILSVRNPDDVSFVGNPSPDNFTGSTAQCNWSRNSTTDSNSLMHLWDQKGGNNTVCYLELRGFVHVPESIVQPQFVFWDVWDIGAQQAAWFEIGVYTPKDADSRYSLDREAIEWHRIDVHTANTLNYNWTRQVFDFVELQSLTGQDFRGQDVTFRFAFANGTDTRQRWHIDDVQIIDGSLGVYGEDIGFDRTFTLNNPTDVNYFLTSGQWSLTSNNTVAEPGTGGSGGCCSWELRPNGPYTKLSTSPQQPHPNSSRDDDRLRVHYVQLAPIIDVTTSAAEDEDGDQGAPMLSFWHGYYVGAYTALEVQYRAEGSEDWIVIPTTQSGARPAGELVDLRNTSVLDQRVMQPVDISLSGIPSSVTRYHLRFALSVHGLNTQQYDGWWIDNIKLHREDRLRFLDYPLFDNAENGVMNWLTVGDWWVTNEKSYSGNHSFTDSPNGNYASANLSGHMVTIFPIDLRNNTPENLNSPDRPMGNTGGTAEQPYLSFWHQRYLSDGTRLEVQWKLQREDDNSWKNLWVYRPNTSYGTNWYASLVNRSWEYVNISLEPILLAIGPASDPYADDVLLRFRLQGGNGSNDGWYIDNIRLDEKPVPNVHNLWEEGTTPTIANQTLGAGDGLIYTASPDDSDWQSRWRLGGNWDRITWESHTGMSSFHDSPDGQTSAPTIVNSPYTPSDNQSYSVLELTDIIDMRGTLRTSLPTLYFWSRFDRGSDNLRVQVSYEMLPSDYGSNLLSHMNSRCGSNAPQCYEQEWGWSRWIDAPGPINNQNACATNRLCSTWETAPSQRQYGWRLWQVDLAYIGIDSVRFTSHNNALGRRIRIRFVVDGQHTNTNGDGWYITDVSIEPLRNQTLATITEGPFVDNAEHTLNWITEGGWGIDPAIGLSTDATLSNLGTWQEYWWAGFDNNRLNNNQYPAMPPGQVYQRTVNRIYYPDTGNTRPAPGYFESPDRATGRWVLDTPVVGTNGVEPGAYYVIARSDDGVRIRWQEIDNNGNVISSPMIDSDKNGIPENIWNIMGSRDVGAYGSSPEGSPERAWRGQGPTTYIGHFELEAGKRYRIIAEYHNSGGGGVITIDFKRNMNFSFADTPRVSPDLSLPDVPPLHNANTSMISAGTFDLRGTTRPYLMFQYSGETCDGVGLHIEYSLNGGYRWDSLMNNITNINVGAGNWQQRSVSLETHRNREIMIRFRLDRQNKESVDCQSHNLPGLFGVWLTEIIVLDAG